MPCICPQCRTRLDSVPMPDGKRRCPECGTLLTAKRSDGRTTKSRALPTVLIVLGICAASFLVLAVGVGLGVYFYLSRTTTTKSGAEVTQRNNPGVVTKQGLVPLRKQLAAPKRELTPLPNSIAVGKPVPEIEAEDIDGNKFKLSDYRGKVVLLDFWGHW